MSGAVTALLTIRRRHLQVPTPRLESSPAVSRGYVRDIPIPFLRDSRRGANPDEGMGVVWMGR